MVGNAQAWPVRVTTFLGEHGLDAAGLGLLRDHARWVEGRQGIIMAQPRGLGCSLPC
jgi:hypothetical protein